MFKKSTREFNVTETVNKVISLVRDKAQSNEIEIRCSFENFPEHSFNIFSDEQRLKQVLLNITSNAIKFTKKGFVHLKINIKELGEYRYLQVQVEDSGIGLSELEQKKLFKLFGMIEGNKQLN